MNGLFKLKLPYFWSIFIRIFADVHTTIKPILLINYSIITFKSIIKVQYKNGGDMSPKSENIRQLIQKGDPRLNVQIPGTIKEFIAKAAKCGKRSVQDEIIRRLAATVKNEDAYNALKGIVAKQIKLTNK